MKEKNDHRKNQNLFRRNTPLYITVLLAIATGAAVYVFFPKPEDVKKMVVVSPDGSCMPEKIVLRSKDYPLTHRVFLSDYKNEFAGLSSTKEKIAQYITQWKTTNQIQSASVYYRNLSNGTWFAVNGNETYNPASLMKVSFLISILKQSERQPGLLNKEMHFEKHLPTTYDQSIRDFALEENKNYSIKELLKYMIRYSDNDATELIMKNIDLEVYSKIFTDLGIQPPDVHAVEANTEYYINVIDCCKLFRVLYTSAYLHDENSEFALELLTQSTYKDGLLKNLKSNFPVAHKFGERVMSNVQELHEIGIFYADTKPYVLGVMTTGHDMKQLSTVLGQISEIIYNESIVAAN